MAIYVCVHPDTIITTVNVPLLVSQREIARQRENSALFIQWQQIET